MREAYVKSYEISQFMLWGTGKKEVRSEFSSWSYPYEKIAMKAQYKSLKACHVFEVDKRLGEVLVHTPNRMRDDIHLPFSTTFVDIILEFEHRKYFGFLILDLDALAAAGHDVITMSKGKKVKRRIIITACGIEDNNTFHVQYALHPFNLLSDDMESGAVTRWHKREKKMLVTAAMNFLDFLNEPDVVVKRMKYDPIRDAKRIKRGKVPLPKVCDRVKVTGKLKVYLNSVKTGKRMPYSHSFWVRGHWRTLRDERYTKKQGQRVWVRPFVKGEGLLVDKTYDAVKEE